MTDPVLALHEVHRRRGAGPRSRPVLAGVDLIVEPGEIVLIEGPSGGGKTTLLSVAAGLLSPDSGTIRLAGHALHDLDAGARRRVRARHLGFVFQRANLLDGLSVVDNVALAGAIAGMTRTRAVEHAMALLARLGMEDLAGRRVATLSGGEEHRVAVARALVHRPTLIFADEPTGQLDRESGHAVAQALGEQAGREGVAVVIASHDPRLRPVAHRRLWMEDGQLTPGGPDDR